METQPDPTPKMNWFYALNGKQAGPVTEEELVNLYRSSTIFSDTLVWRDGMANWTALATAMPELFATTPDPQTPADGTPGTPLIPVSPIPSQDPWISEEELLTRDYPIDIGGCISGGWGTFFQNPWALLGGSLLAWFLLMVATLVPFIGVFAQWFLFGPLIGGVYMLYLTQVRRGSTDVGLIFSAFGPRFWQHVLVYLVQACMQFALTLPLVGVLFGGAMALGLAGHNKADLDQLKTAVGAGAITLVCLIGFATWAVMMAVSILWFFAVPLVADKGYGFWEALQLSRKMVAKHFWWTLLFFLAVGGVSVLGVFACFVGMFISLPVAFAAITLWYENVFGRLRPKTFQAA
jgi:hypothetical protein